MTYVLKVNGAISHDHFGILCARLYESQASSHHNMKGLVDFSNLRQVVKEHFEKKQWRPHTGYDAELSRVDERIKKLFSKHDKDRIIQKLQQKGYASLNIPLLTTLDSNKKLSQFLIKKTKQGSNIRTDTVAFLDKADAMDCELKFQFEVLMGLGSFLNDHLQFERTGHEPLLPGTESRPLSTPRTIQAAEYGYGEFYVAHSDNLLLSPGVRSNYRLYTCILYCNNNWNINEDGGALRIYPQTTHLTDPSDAIQMKYDEINPCNGKLLIFDSRLVHSVEKVTSLNKKRRALTLWLMRPENEGVHTDIWDEENGKVDWYKLS